MALLIVVSISFRKLEPFLGTLFSGALFWLLLLIGARYKDKKPHFEISVK
jgi:hypothetical protein